MRRVLSPLVEMAMGWPSRTVVATPQTELVWPVRGAPSCWWVCRSQIRRVLSSLPEMAMGWPSRDAVATDITYPVCPVRGVPICWWVCRSQIRRVLSPPAEMAIGWPSRVLVATPETQSVWPVSTPSWIGTARLPTITAARSATTTVAAIGISHRGRWRRDTGLVRVGGGVGTTVGSPDGRTTVSTTAADTATFTSGAPAVSATGGADAAVLGTRLVEVAASGSAGRAGGPAGGAVGEVVVMGAGAAAGCTGVIADRAAVARSPALG